jgi:hypothetical protein
VRQLATPDESEATGAGGVHMLDLLLEGLLGAEVSLGVEKRCRKDR